MSEIITQETAEARMRALTRGGFGPGLPRRRNDRWIVLDAARRALPPGDRWNERAVNEALYAWLGSLGPKVTADFVTFRRGLVDEGFVGREHDCSAYFPSRAHESRVRFTAGA